MLATVATCALLAFTQTAHAQSATVDQVQLGDAYSTLRIEVSEANDVAGAAVSGGNSLTAHGEGEDIDIATEQHADFNADADAHIAAWQVQGSVVSNATSTNNGLTADAIGSSIRASASQITHGDTSATTNVGNGASYAAVSSAAAGANVAALNAENGDINAALNQESTGAVRATTAADHVNWVSTQVSSATIASANNVTASGATTTMTLDATQRASGAGVSARNEMYVGATGDAIGNATANGNSVTATNEWGYANVRADQDNTANVEAASTVTLGGEWAGFGSAASYGVGNAATISNVGSDTMIDVAQANSGAVSSDSAFSGGAGGDALVASSAYGNSISGGLCATACSADESAINATSSQINGGPVRASATINASRANTAAASATAIGNAATYQSSGRGP